MQTDGHQIGRQSYGPMRYYSAYGTKLLHFGGGYQKVSGPHFEASLQALEDQHPQSPDLDPDIALLRFILLIPGVTDIQFTDEFVAVYCEDGIDLSAVDDLMLDAICNRTGWVRSLTRIVEVDDLVL